MEYILLIVIGSFIVFYLIENNKDDEPKSGITVTYDWEKDDEYTEYEPAPVRKYWPQIEWIQVKAKLRITYTNTKKETSKRTIRIQGYDGSPYLEGFCERRDAQRTFRIDRIQNAIDAETGEIIRDVPDYLLRKYHESSEYMLLKIFSDYLDVIKVFLYIGKADGQLRSEEHTSELQSH